MASSLISKPDVHSQLLCGLCLGSRIFKQLESDLFFSFSFLEGGRGVGGGETCWQSTCGKNHLISQLIECGAPILCRKVDSDPSLAVQYVAAVSDLCYTVKMYFMS